MPTPLYFDHAAATTLRPEAKVISTDDLGGNPSSVHACGRKAKAIIDEARITLAEMFLVAPKTLIFTSGATEAVHLGLIGAYLAKPDKKGVIYATPLGHSCVNAALNFLVEHYQVTIKYLPLTTTGHIDLEAIDDDLIGESDMIVIEHLNSEVGILQPAAKLGKKLIRWAEEQQKSKPIFMVDAAGSAVSERVGLDFQKCDLLSLSAEKIGGLSGTGVLLKHQDLALKPLQGGSQEWGWRGGTENVVGIKALHMAYEAHFKNLEAQNSVLEAIKTDLLHFFEEEFPEYQILTPKAGSGLHILQVLSPAVPGNLLVAQADLAGVALSSGSACSSGTAEGSAVLKALGVKESALHNGLRLSWGWDTSLADVETLKTRLREIL